MRNIPIGRLNQYRFEQLSKLELIRHFICSFVDMNFRDDPYVIGTKRYRTGRYLSDHLPYFLQSKYW